VADTGRAGLRRARDGGFDLIVLDIMLPEVNGYRLCRALRAEQDWTPILMLTAKSGEYDEAEGLETGADDFLTKPFSMVVLHARVRALLRRPRRHGGWPPVGGLQLDPVRRTCRRGTTTVSLTDREVEVLAHLLEHPDQVVGKTDLLRDVWGRDFDGDPNIVEVYIRRLRRKLDGSCGEPVIETVRGEGYRLRTTGAG
jgi:DNA-binding response OmpR family regulator